VEYIRQIVEGAELASVISLPRSFRSGKVEVIVMAIEETLTSSKYSGNNIDEMLKNSITQSLIGAIPITEISLEEIREERLRKYESVD
jgi:hypothetical protein